MKGTLRNPKKDEMKFSAFLKNEKDYSVEPQLEAPNTADPYIAKPEVSEV